MKMTKRIPTCNICGKHFKTTQGLGGHRVLYHRSNKDEGHNLIIDKSSLDNFISRLASIETDVRGLKSAPLKKLELPFWLWLLAVCPKCGLVFQYDKTYRKGNIMEGDHFECPRCGPVKEVFEVLSRQKINAKEWGKETPEEKEDQNK